ncbi:thymidylate synthase [Abyssicoccus albus]|uniref:thymidylate synthase n=1 Tax=Abyssicoccus albus TaxID=1817405 RepID=UPI00097E295E|nr:thymidylate synthase [Abyssicoccus albus]AQL56193.1 thymidylate synthase [Abyssicoccus albus]
MNHADEMYLELCRTILNEANSKEDRTNTGTYSIFGYQMRFNLADGFPLLTTKKVPFKLIVSELLWFIKGDTNIKYLLEHNNHIWDEWAFEQYVKSADYNGPDMTNFGHRILTDQQFKAQYDEQMSLFQHRILNDDDFADQYGDLGNVYGKQWRAFNGRDGKVVDQLKDVIESIKHTPSSRRHIVSAWNPTEIDSMALPPCHTLFQFYVRDNKLSLQLYQRSADVFLGVPFNIASYALLLHIVALECNLEVGEFVHTMGDAHIYSNHIEQVNAQLERNSFELPNIKIYNFSSFDEVEVEDIELIGYQSHPTIKAPIAV